MNMTAGIGCVDKPQEREQEPRYTIEDIDIQPFKTWVKNLTKDNTVIINKEKDKIWKIHLYTEKHHYSIMASKPSNYLGCIMQNTYIHPGESWTRGSDLPDGKLNEETWKEILNAIIRTELKVIDYGSMKE